MASIYRKLGVAVALALAPLSLMTGGCATLGNPPLGGTLADERALILAEVAYSGVLRTVNSAIDAGLLVPGSKKALQVSASLDKANAVMVAARAAQRAGNEQQAIALAFTVQQLLVELVQFLRSA